MRIPIVIAVGIMVCQAQTPKPSSGFEVASIKPSPHSDEGRTPWRNKETPAGIDYKYMSVSTLILKAFGIEDYQLILPRGYRPQEWDIVARAPENSRVQDIPLMLRGLLADRFEFEYHRETKEMAVYALVVAKGGSKLKEVAPPEGGLGGNRTAEGMSHWKGRVRLSLLAQSLSHVMQAPVINQTGLMGIYEIEFEYAPPTAGIGFEASLPGPTISAAMESFLGLKMEPRKQPIEILVVDHLAAPTAN